MGRPFTAVSPGFLERARAYDWPGNIRELENLVERALIMSNDGTLEAQHLSFGLDDSSGPVAPLPTRATLEDVERAHIRSMLAQTGWRIEGERGAAALLGLNPSTLRGRIRKLGIRKTS